ncbi:hypothetical protein KA005_11180 [bacterium]|nr:hypothetical protein [bacterium]
MAYDGRFFATGIRAKGHADFNAIQGTSSSASNASGHFTSTVGGRVAYFIQSGVGSIRDNITIIRSQSTGTVSGNIIYINDTPTATVNGGSLLLAYGDNYELNFNPRVANSASAVAYSFDTENNLTTVGAKLLSLENQGSEKFYIDKDGAIYQLPISHSLTDSTPTDAEIDAATGTTPSVAGSGWQRLILDSDGSALMYIIVSDGSNWQYTAMTIAL